MYVCMYLFMYVSHHLSRQPLTSIASHQACYPHAVPITSHTSHAPITPNTPRRRGSKWYKIIKVYCLVTEASARQKLAYNKGFSTLCSPCVNCFKIFGS